MKSKDPLRLKKMRRITITFEIVLHNRHNNFSAAVAPS